MNFPFYIARRYLFAKKSTNAINVISGVAVTGVAVATMALVVTLSVFNGFHDMVATFFTSFDPQLKVVPATGKWADRDDEVLKQIRALPQIDVATESVEDQALAVYRDRQAVVTVKGVDDNFAELMVNSALLIIIMLNVFIQMSVSLLLFLSNSIACDIAASVMSAPLII